MVEGRGGKLEVSEQSPQVLKCLSSQVQSRRLGYLANNGDSWRGEQSIGETRARAA